MASTQANNKLFKIASSINIGREAIVEYLASKGFKVENKATTVLTDEMVDLVNEKFAKEKKVAEKVRSKMERQQEVRKTLQEQGNAVSIDSIAQQHEAEERREAVVEQPVAPRPVEQPVAEARAETPREPIAEAAPEPVAEQPVAEEAAAPVSAPAEVVAEVPEPEPVATQEPEPQVTSTPVEAVAEQPSVEAPEESTSEQPQASGPAVGQKIDLKAIKRTSTKASGWDDKELRKSIQPGAKATPLTPPSQPSAPASAPTAASTVKEQPQASVTSAQAPAGQRPAAETSTTAQPTASTPAAASAATGEKPAQGAKPGAEATKPAEGAEATDTADDGTKKKRPRKNVIEVQYQSGVQLKGLTVIGKIDLKPKHEPKPKRPERSNDRGNRDGGKSTIGDALAARGRSNSGTSGTSGSSGGGSSTFGSRPSTPRPGGGGGAGGGRPSLSRKDDKKKKKAGGPKGRESFSDSDVERAIRATLAGMEDSGLSGRAKQRLKRRLERETREQMRQEERLRESSTLRLSEFVTTADLANLMRVSAPEIIMKCMGLGLMVSINQRLDRDTITLIASDYGYSVEFLDDQTSQDVEDDEDPPETLKPRPPIVTIMGHVDHGKTSLLDYIRSANVVAGEAGGITQHIGAYRVITPSGRAVSFLDTPGHEAFTAMRARGAQVTDIVILVVSADDSVMPQTIEAISHAQAANVPIVVAINKIDKPDANPDRIRQQLADHGVLVEDWGGKYQVVELSAKTGKNVDLLLEKILLEADLLELKANPDRRARGTVIEAHIDKGRGNVVTIMVQKGTLDVGDIFVCGQHAGRVRAMFDERGNRVDSAGPAMPVQVTGFDGLPDAGDILVEMETDAEARDVATRRQQLRREQQFRGMRHMTLDDISAQIQQGGVKDLRLVVKADVSGSVEALSDSLQKLSTNEVKVSILLKGVGAITESDIMLAAASDAVIIGFQTSVSTQARKLAESESVEIRLYSIIYDCINDVQMALEGMLTPDIKEEITATVEVRATFKISRLGTIAGCMVQSGKITRNDKVRILRDGFEIYKGTLASLKRVKDDVREVDAGYECGIGVNGFNDLEVGDIIEAYKTVEVKRKLA